MVNMFVWWNKLKLDYTLHLSKLYLKLLLRFAVRSVEIRPSRIYYTCKMFNLGNFKEDRHHFHSISHCPIFPHSHNVKMAHSSFNKGPFEMAPSRLNTAASRFSRHFY